MRSPTQSLHTFDAQVVCLWVFCTPDLRASSTSLTVPSALHWLSVGPSFFCETSVPLHASQLQLIFYHSPDWRGLCAVYLSMLWNSAYRALRVLSCGQNYHFHTVVMEEPWWNGLLDILRWCSPPPPPPEWLVEELYAKTISAKLFSWFLKRIEKQHGIFCWDLRWASSWYKARIA